MIKTKLNIPATLVHTYENTQYMLDGVLLSINESNDTCTMKFDGNVIEAGIPMSKVMINEGFLDKIKEYGKKVVSYITQKVKGFIALVDEKAGVVFPWSLNNVGNIAIMGANGQLPEGIHFAPTESLKAIAGCGGESLEEAFAGSIANDRNQIIKYWSRVIDRYGNNGNTEETLEESIKYVNENYYKESPMYKNALNENVVYSYKNIKDKKGNGYYGQTKNAKSLKVLLKENIRNQISGPLGGHADIIPVLIWGAPGIGKSAIVYTMVKELRNSKFNPIHLNMEVIQLAGYTIENWTLPKNYTKSISGIELSRFSDTPKTWLPVYLHSTDPEENKKRDAFCNACKFLATDESGEIYDETNHPFEGGVVFFDEYSRVAPNVQNILMALGGDHKFGDNYRVASKWGFVFASNRAIDEGEPTSEDKRYFPTAAQNNRFQHVTYEPTKKEWIEWARSIDKLTHEANVPPFIVDFIEASPDHVWYSTIENGGYEDKLENPDIDRIAHQQDVDADGTIEAVLQQAALKTKRMVTPRIWANTVGPQYKLQLQNIFNGNAEGKTGEEYYKELVNKSVIEKIDPVTGESYKEYYGGILPQILIDALNEVDEEYWEWWVDEHGGRETLDPGNVFYGERGRYNMFMAWFINMVRTAESDDNDQPTSVTNNPLVKAWDEYQSFAKNMTPDVYEKIWTTSEMPKEYQNDDNYTPMQSNKFSETEYCKWKVSSATTLDVIEQLKKYYPGNMEEDVNEFLKNPDVPNLSASEVQALVKKYKPMFDITLREMGGSTKENFLFGPDVMASTEMQKIIVSFLDTYKFCRNFACAAKWVAKVSIQLSSGHIASSFSEYLKDFIKNSFPNDRIRLNNGQNYAKARQAYDANKKDQKLALAAKMESMKTIMYPAFTQLSKAKEYELARTRQKK